MLTDTPPPARRHNVSEDIPGFQSAGLRLYRTQYNRFLPRFSFWRARPDTVPVKGSDMAILVQFEADPTENHTKGKRFRPLCPPCSSYIGFQTPLLIPPSQRRSAASFVLRVFQLCHTFCTSSFSSSISSSFCILTIASGSSNRV